MAPLPHVCDRSWYDDARDGAIRRCDDCGRYWTANTSAFYTLWYPVRWWNFAARKHIRQFEAGKAVG